MFFISDLDPSGIDLQHSWEQALKDFNAPASFVRLRWRDGKGGFQASRRPRPDAAPHLIAFYGFNEVTGRKPPPA